MIRSLAASALAILALSGPGSAQEAATARIQVLRGRALVQAGGSPLTLLRTQEHSSSEPVRLEVGAGAQVEIQWLGTASMKVWGPTSMEWTPNADSSLAWTFSDLAWADLEVRRGEHRLDLPGSWRTTVTGGALHLRGLPSGPVELRHHAGRPLLLEWRGDAKHVRPPVAVYAGSSLRLEMPTDADGSVHAWTPRARREQPLPPSPPPVERRVGLDPAGGETSAKAPAVGRARQPEFIAPEDVRVETRTGRQSASEPLGELAPDPSTEPLPPLHEAYQAARAQERAEDPWRGVRVQQMSKAGPLVIERSRDIEVRVTAAGSWKVLLDAAAPGPVWCFGPGEDVRLSPGSVVTFGADGHLRLRFGQVEVRQAPGWRQPLNPE